MQISMLMKKEIEIKNPQKILPWIGAPFMAAWVLEGIILIVGFTPHLLFVNYLKKLKTINKLACLKSLEMLKISDCNGVEELEETFSQLKTLKELSILTLTLETVAPQYLKSLSFIKEMKALQSFKSNYVIVDKDLTPLLRLKNAEIFEDKSYYKIKNKNLPKWDKDR